MDVQATSGRHWTSRLALSVTGIVLVGASELCIVPAYGQTGSQIPDANAPAQAADTQNLPKPVETLSGEWGGARTKLRDAGVDITAAYTSEFAANVSGGIHKGATETGQFAFGTDLDLQKLISVDGGRVRASITYRRGKDLGEEAGLGVLQQVQEIYGRGQTWRLTELWYQQDFGRGMDVKLGRMPQGADFNSFSCDFQNLSFCGAPAGNIAGDYWYNWPVAVWGARLRMKQRNWFVMTGAYESNSHNLENDFAFSHGGAQGVLIPLEAGWTPRFGRKGLPGSYRIGAWYNSANGNDVLLGPDRLPVTTSGTTPLRRAGRYGAYILLQQQLSGTYEYDPTDGPKATQGLTIFFNFIQTDRKTQRTDNQMAAGLFYVGPLAMRPDDDVGVAIARTSVNGRAARRDALLAVQREQADAEYAGELYYGVHLKPWLIIRPNLQYIMRPGGYHAANAIVVLGMKSAITF